MVFSTPTLSEPLEISGRIRVKLYASSSAEDTMFTAKLCDVYPDGRSIYITDGVLRAACRESISTPTPLEAKKQYRFTIDLGTTSIILNAGHRLRLDITSSNAPDFRVHPNAFGKGDPRPAAQTVYYGPGGPSALLVPVVDTASQQLRVWKP
jgi:putative CocE/NonD family hydrolase